jgi:hypothetical protein
VVAEFHTDAPGRLVTGVRQQAEEDDLLLAVALELMVEVGVREAARRPVFGGDDVTRLYLEVVVEGATPRTFGESLPLGRTELVGDGYFQLT